MDKVHYDPDQIPLWEKWGTETLHWIIDGRQQYLEDRGEIIKAAISYKFVRFDNETYKMCIDYGQSAGFISIWNLWVIFQLSRIKMQYNIQVDLF